MLTFPRIFISPPRPSSSRIPFPHRFYPRLPPFKAPSSSRIRFPHRFSSSHHRLPPFRAPSSSCIPSHRFPSSVLVLTFRAPSSSCIPSHRFPSSVLVLTFRASCIPSHRFPSSVLLTFRAPSSSRIFEILLNKSLLHILKISCTWLRSVIFFFFLLGFE